MCECVKVVRSGCHFAAIECGVGSSLLFLPPLVISDTDQIFTDTFYSGGRCARCTVLCDASDTFTKHVRVGCGVLHAGHRVRVDRGWDGGVHKCSSPFNMQSVSTREGVCVRVCSRVRCACTHTHHEHDQCSAR